jgi:mono/diheme cytochrome c family protein
MRLARLAAAFAVAAGIAAAGADASAAKNAVDLQVKMKLSSVGTVAPVAKIKIKNKGTADQSGVVLRILGEDADGPELWSGIVNLPPGKSANVTARVFLEEDGTCLVAVADPATGVDATPFDNISRGSLGASGSPGLALVARAAFLAHCASCHGSTAGGIGDAPSLVGTSSKDLLARVAEGGTHDFPWLGKTDARSFSLFLKAPTAVVLPPALPEPPAGGWPTWETGGVKDLLVDRCGNCHGGKKGDAGIWLDSYNAASKASSRALGAVKNGSMPQGGKRFNAEEVALLQNWIKGGLRP